MTLVLLKLFELIGGCIVFSFVFSKIFCIAYFKAKDRYAKEIERRL